MTWLEIRTAVEAAGVKEDDICTLQPGCRERGITMKFKWPHFSKTFKGGRTRLTAGGYDFSPNVVAVGAHRGGGQFGFEQAVNAKFSVQADWFTGKQASGYFTPGFYVKPHPKVTLYGGYSIGNADVGKGNHFFYTAIGINLN
jgi:hypothetical protein